ncbi:cytochrome P450 71A1-like [Olea europaea subsp. europaea]|uniref:Cytochrome P450 71A1-like n=1 Tax=Olea europaea subsp. europaea TaxID=158383 RepID=A0A8S0V5R5_OLEEU|nr:cytochrome P450 71A1-like [Olea europaea subsp. europaea]
MCPGYSLGLKVIQASLANLLHGFKWRLADDMTPKNLNMEEIFGLSTPRKFPLAAVVEPRLPLNLYFLEILAIRFQFLFLSCCCQIQVIWLVHSLVYVTKSHH